MKIQPRNNQKRARRGQNGGSEATESRLGSKSTHAYIYFQSYQSTIYLPSICELIPPIDRLIHSRRMTSIQSSWWAIPVSQPLTCPDMIFEILNLMIQNGQICKLGGIALQLHNSSLESTLDSNFTQTQNQKLRPDWLSTTAFIRSAHPLHIWGVLWVVLRCAWAVRHLGGASSHFSASMGGAYLALAIKESGRGQLLTCFQCIENIFCRVFPIHS